MILTAVLEARKYRHVVIETIHCETGKASRIHVRPVEGPRYPTSPEINLKLSRFGDAHTD